jgi:hypothetical protein
MRRQEEPREVDEVTGQWKLSPDRSPAVELVLGCLLIGGGPREPAGKNRSAQRQSRPHQKRSTVDVRHRNLLILEKKRPSSLYRLFKKSGKGGRNRPLAKAR